MEAVQNRAIDSYQTVGAACLPLLPFCGLQRGPSVCLGGCAAEQLLIELSTGTYENSRWCIVACV